MENFKDKVVYQVYPKSFCDSNGDGIGDIQGIISKLDYLKELGVDYIWSTPFFVSPQNDNGYDIADYRNIEPMFGTMEDVEELIAEADKRGIGMMFDMVFNHTSTNHEWFQKALAGDKKYQDYYIFKDGEPDTPPTNWISKFGGSAWKYLPELKKWYLCLYDVTQADLNWENPEVREELKEVIRFWKKKGVKGFRFDVINVISKPEIFEDDHEGDGRRFYTDGRHVHEFLQELVRDTDIHDMITVGEMSSTSLDNCVRYTRPADKELSMAFNFHHLKVDYPNGEKWELMEPDKMVLKNLFATWQEGMQAEDGWNALFWCCHDQPRVVSRFGDDKTYWKESAKMLAAMTHLMRGTPYIYEGEELGMTNNYYADISQYRDVESLNYFKILTENGKTEEEAYRILGERSRDNARTPMQWDASEKAGFTTGEPWIPIPTCKPEANVKDELADEDSIYYFYKKLIRLRKEHKIISEGDIHFCHRDDERILAYERTLDGQKLIVACNLTGEEVNVATDADLTTMERFVYNYADAPKVSAEQLTLRPFEVVAYLR